MRILKVAAFAVSGYASSIGRSCKPFNPLLGETYEADFPEKGIRFISEKVSHHPMLIACHCEGKGWKFWGDSNLTSKFWGQSIQLDPVGVLTLEFDDGEILQWSKVQGYVEDVKGEKKLPPTDSRLRPDQRHLENGEYEKANAEKLRLEKRQRMVCV
ncbi:hypothetical protein BHM03_00009195 [Ensete ventricosum]|nr:hypothetical protein BHM03_00009195 [Ensete ventricosum]